MLSLPQPVDVSRYRFQILRRHPLRALAHRAIKYAGDVYKRQVAACGLAGGFTLPTTVMPFILRNVRLQGVDSVMTVSYTHLRLLQRVQHAATVIFIIHIDEINNDNPAQIAQP